MGNTFSMLRSERRARVMLATVAQSSLGTGAGYVALLLVAYDRWRSPWAISLILLAEFLPSMLFGPLYGAAADRWPRRRCVVIADVMRALAFAGVAVVGSFELTLALALVAGAGTALFRPSMLSAIPGLVREERIPATTSAYGAVTDVGYTLGPALAAGILVFATSESLLVANGATFLISALVLGRLDFGPQEVSAEDSERQSLLADTRRGIQVVMGMRPIAILVGLMAGSMLSGGIFNVIELPFAEEELGAGDSGYSGLVAALGLGFLAGSLAGAAGGTTALLKRRFIQGVILTGLGGLFTAASPSLAIALAAFALGGFGNGLFVTYQRLLIQAEVPGAFQGRTFALTDTLTSWAMVLALLAGGALTAVMSPRALMAATGVWEVALGVLAAVVLRAHWRSSLEGGGGKPRSDGRAHLLPEANLGQQEAHVVGGTALWLGILDDLDEGGHDRRVELRPRIGL
jgi:MFS family permease